MRNLRAVKWLKGEEEEEASAPKPLLGYKAIKPVKTHKSRIDYIGTVLASFI